MTYLVDEVCGLDGPAERNFGPLDLNLLGEDVVADLLPGLAQVGPPPEHALVRDHAHREVVDRAGVVLAAHDFGRHVAGRARGVLRVVFPPHARDPEVRDAQVPVALDHKVLRLYVPMNNILIVDVLETCY